MKMKAMGVFDLRHQQLISLPEHFVSNLIFFEVSSIALDRTSPNLCQMKSKKS